MFLVLITIVPYKVLSNSGDCGAVV